MTDQDKIKLSKLLFDCIKLDPSDSYFKKRFYELNEFILEHNPPTQKEVGRFWMIVGRFKLPTFEDYVYFKKDWKHLYLGLIPDDLYKKKIYLLRNRNQSELSLQLNGVINLELEKILIDNLDYLTENCYDDEK